jgi:hypothetical protein
MLRSVTLIRSFSLTSSTDLQHASIRVLGLLTTSTITMLTERDGYLGLLVRLIIVHPVAMKHPLASKSTATATLTTAPSLSHLESLSPRAIWSPFELPLPLLSSKLFIAPVSRLRPFAEEACGSEILFVEGTAYHSRKSRHSERSPKTRTDTYPRRRSAVIMNACCPSRTAVAVGMLFSLELLWLIELLGCLDRRPEQSGYEHYVDGQGLVSTASRSEGYCMHCKQVEVPSEDRHSGEQVDPKACGHAGCKSTSEHGCCCECFSFLHAPGNGSID